MPVAWKPSLQNSFRAVSTSFSLLLLAIYNKPFTITIQTILFISSSSAKSDLDPARSDLFKTATTAIKCHFYSLSHALGTIGHSHWEKIFQNI